MANNLKTKLASTAELLPLTWKSEDENDRPENVKTNLFHSEGGAA